MSVAICTLQRTDFFQAITAFQKLTSRHGVKFSHCHRVNLEGTAVPELPIAVGLSRRQRQHKASATAPQTAENLTDIVTNLYNSSRVHRHGGTVIQ